MVKKNPENKFKKLILTWWIWVIVGFFFSFFSSKTAQYISFLAFLFVIILGGISLINYIHKKSIGDYWKVSLTIIGIILIIVVAFFYIKDFSVSNNKQRQVKDRLEREGYEVLDVHYSDFTDGPINETWVSVRMKSSGNLNEQAWKGLINLAVTYKDVDKYMIILLTPTRECIYSIPGGIYRAYRNNEVYPKDRTDLYSSVLYNWVESQNIKEIKGYVLWDFIDYKIKDETKFCS